MAKATPKTESVQLVKASANALHIAPRKMRLVTNLVKNSYALDAIVQLQHANKKAAPMLIKLIKSAIANAENNFNLKPESLYIKSITADMGKTMKRYFPRARGSAFVIRRKMSHVDIILEERSKGTARSKVAQLITKKTKPETESKTPETSAEVKPESTLPKNTSTIKTSEQVKANTVAQKRRLFNRKTGV